MCLNFKQSEKLSNASPVEGGWHGEMYITPQKKNKEVVSTPWEATRREYGGLAVHKELLRTAKTFFPLSFCSVQQSAEKRN